MLVEIVVEMFVGVIDAELLKAVVAEVFKSKDVQHPYGVTLHT